MRKEIIIISLSALIFRLAFLSPWLEDWDSVQFALALHDFDITKHQPHAPGYPIYILLGKLLYLFTGNDTQALVLLSSLLGSFIIVPFYLLTRLMFGKLTGLIASSLLVLTPVEWVLSETALTNIPGLFFLVLWAYLLFLWSGNRSKLIFVSYFGGLILGVRFTELPVILALLGLVLSKHNLKYILTCAIFFFVGAITWLAPLITVTGLQEFTSSYFWIANYVIRHDASLENRPQQLWYLLNLGYTPYFLGLSFISVLQAMFKKRLQQFKYQFLIIWLATYLLPLIFIYNLEVPRYTLPLLPPLAILTGASLSDLVRRYKISVLLSVFLVVILFKESYAQVKLQKTSLPPTIAPVLWAKDNLDPNGTLIIATFTYRQFQYYSPEFEIFHPEKFDFDLDKIPSEKTVIIDYIGLTNKIEPLKDFEIVETLEFQGNKDIFPRISETNLYVLKHKQHD